MALRFFSSTRRARSSLHTLEELMQQSAKKTEYKPYNYVRTSRSPDTNEVFSRTRVRARVPRKKSLILGRYFNSYGTIKGRSMGTAVKLRSNSSGLRESEIELQYRELMGARAKRMKNGEYAERNNAETIRVISDAELNRYYTVSRHPIGEGTYGSVFKGKCLQSGETVAIKVMDKSAQPRYKREIEMIKRINFKGVVRLLRVIDSPGKVFLITEYLKGGDLFDYIADNNVYIGNMTIRKTLEITRAMLCSLEACHLLDFAHLDVKPENFVFRTSSEDYKDLVLVDFGASQPFRLKSFARGTQDYVGGMDDYWIGEPESHIGGTASYVSPEVVIQGRFSSRSDMWSMGVTLYMMLTGQRPFDPAIDSLCPESSQMPNTLSIENEIQKKIKAEVARARNKSVFNTCVDLQDIHEGTKQLLIQMTQPDPSMRPSTTEAIHYIDLLLADPLPGDTL